MRHFLIPLTLILCIGNLFCLSRFQHPGLEQLTNTYEMYIDDNDRATLSDELFVGGNYTNSIYDQTTITFTPYSPVTATDYYYITSTEDYYFSTAAGDQITCTVDVGDQDDFDIYLYHEGVEIASEVDGLEGEDETLTITAPATGDYNLQVWKAYGGTSVETANVVLSYELCSYYTIELISDGPNGDIWDLEANESLTINRFLTDGNLNEQHSFEVKVTNKLSYNGLDGEFCITYPLWDYGYNDENIDFHGEEITALKLVEDFKWEHLECLPAGSTILYNCHYYAWFLEGQPDGVDDDDLYWLNYQEDLEDASRFVPCDEFDPEMNLVTFWGITAPNTYGVTHSTIKKDDDQWWNKLGYENIEAVSNYNLLGPYPYYYGTSHEFFKEFVPTSAETPLQVENKLNFNFPNPFNPETKISYCLKSDAIDSRLDIFNVKGQKVKGYVLDNKAGNNTVTWKGTDNSGKKVSSGIYFSKLITNGKVVSTKKMMLLK